MILLSARELSRQFEADPVFRDVTFDVRPGERIGLVGPNGAGKTTLLNVLSGRDDPDTGRVNIHPSVELALLEQQPVYPAGRTLLDEARSGLDHLYALQRQAADLAEQMASERDSAALERLQQRYDDVESELRRLDAYTVEHRVDEVLLGLGFSRDDYERPLTEFSGGQQSRAALARLLLRAPELLLLDEPTNHLDIAATEWLESCLARWAGSLILVSHDRYFFDRVTTRILELAGGRATDYPGNFTAYQRQRAERVELERRTWEKQQEFIAKTEEFIRRNKYGQKHAQAADREKKLERLETVDKPAELTAPPMRFSARGRPGDWVIDADGVAKSFDRPLFKDLTLRIHRGDRLGILGPNGSGKTTLLRTLIRELEPDAGTVRLGTGVEIGYLDQHLAGVDPGLDAVEATRPPGRPEVTPGDLRNLLARFGIRGDMGYQQVGSMSGGERSKVGLARLAALEANVLVLDEPTNHLDLWARDALEDALERFEGTLIFVSHDRYFIDRVATSVIVLEPDRWWLYEGNYSSYAAFRRNQQVEVAADASTDSDGKSSAGGAATSGAASGEPRREKPVRRKRRFPYRKVEDLEADIAAHEARLNELEAALAEPELHRDGERVKQTLDLFEDTRSRLKQLYEHWEEAVELN
ncbi:MAG: ABC-F family ATP-binding cassette domain-containing protein [Planctomycetes bacterium]|nr:ABC-F family ATP-binding cassette domain-containing protein [Planctomycetota bacterium]